MPPDTAPGQVLSSVLPASEKRRRSKLGGCANVLFQIFHGKRLFPRKSLPAERPKHGSINHTEDKLPIAKLLLIADENRGGSLKDDAEEELEVQIEEFVPNDEPCDEEKVSKRTPSVVARLMGLDSMPSPDLAAGEKNGLELQRKDMDCQFLSDIPQENSAPLEKSWKTSARVQPYTSSHMARTRESKSSLPKKFTTQQKTLFWKDKARNDVAKSKPTTKSPSLPPHHLDASFPSVVSSSKKGDNVNKGSVRTQKTARLLESAAKMLEASTQHNTQTRKQKLQNSTSKSGMGSLNATQIHQGQSIGEQVHVDLRNEVVQETTAVQAPSRRQNEAKAYSASRDVNNKMVSRRNNASSAAVPKVRRPQVGYAGHEEGPGGCRAPLDEAAPVQRKDIYQEASTQPRSNLVEKVKAADWRRQEETSRRLSKPAVHRLKCQGAARIRHPSPPKSCQDSSGGPCSSQASNSTRRSSDGAGSSQLSGSHVSSNQVPVRRLSSSSDVEDSSDPKEILRPSQSVYRKTAGLSHGNVSLVQNLSMPVSSQFGETDNSLYSQDGSISSVIYTESHRRSSMESLLSSDPSLSECTTSSEECSSFPIRVDTVGHESAEEAWGRDKSTLKNNPKRALDAFMDEDSSQSNFESLPSDLGDTISARTQSEASSKWHKSAHTYSGKNTAAILQELLIALSSSSSRRTSEENMKPRVESTEPCTSDSNLGQLEKPLVLPKANALYTEDLEDSASCNSSDSSDIQQILGSKPGEITDSFLEKTQGEEESSADTEDTAQTCVQHGVPEMHADVVDCEALMSTLSKLHDIDPKAIGLNVRAKKHDTEGQITAAVVPGGGLSSSLIDSVLFNKLEEQAQQRNWGLFNSTTVSAEDDEDSVFKSDMECSFTNGYEEAAAQNKKLLTDCINEAFTSLSKQLYEVSSSISQQSSASHVLNRVYKQIDEWRQMAISMNLDDMVEKEMNLTTRRWRNIGAEAEEIAVAVESNILSGLMEEILLELI